VTWDDITRDWDRYRSVIREKWDFLSDGDLDEVTGDRDRLIEKIEAKYGLTRHRAEEGLDALLRELDKAA
jgi:uncharacterized protein YjbJ (UPF0337 family)